MSGEDFTPGRAIDLAPGVRRITAPNPGYMTGPGTNTYLVGGDEVTVVDPGVDDAGHLDAIVAAAPGPIRRILITHNHPDHTGGARALAARTGARIHAHPTPLQGVRDRGFRADEHLDEGDEVTGADYRMRCLHTPGHTTDHLCFLHEETGLLFAGDHVMAGVTVVIAPPDGDMVAYLASLERLKRESITAFAPAHGGLMRPPAAVLDDVIAHRLEREAQVRAVLAAEPDGIGVDDIVARLYTDVPEPLRPVAAYLVYAHLLKLRAEGWASGEDIESPWRAA